MDMTKLLLSEWNALLMAAVWILMASAERAMPDLFEKGRIGNRLEPVFPIAICLVCSTLVPGPWMPHEASTAQKVILGIVMGAGAYNFAGIAKRLGFTPFLASFKKKS